MGQHTRTHPAAAYIAAALLLTLAGCSGPSTSAPQTSNAPPSATPAPTKTLKPTATPTPTVALSDQQTVWNMIYPGSTPEIQVQLADAICGGFDSGVDMDTQVQTLEWVRGIDTITAGLMIHAAVAYTCPEHVGLLTPGS